jgi:hypothetical protein
MKARQPPMVRYDRKLHAGRDINACLVCSAAPQHDEGVVVDWGEAVGQGYYCDTCVERLGAVT